MILTGSRQPFSTFGEGEDGELYVAQHGSGDVFLITAGDPVISPSGVVNAASFGAGLVPGSLATLFGTGLTSWPGIVSADRFPLATELAGTRVTLNGTPVALVGLASTGVQEQINFQVPFTLAGATRATLAVRTNGQSTTEIEIPIVAAQPEVFLTRDGTPALTSSSGTPIRDAARGSTVTIYATGLGAVSNPPETGRAALADPVSNLVAPVEVTLGDVPAQVLFAGLAPGFAGLYQLNVVVPPTAPAGEVGLLIHTSGATSKRVTLTLR
jgi:uncharacterized protein (TIGR03437 family)